MSSGMEAQAEWHTFEKGIGVVVEDPTRWRHVPEQAEVGERLVSVGGEDDPLLLLLSSKYDEKAAQSLCR